MRLSPPKSYDPWFSLLSTRRYTLIDIAWLWSLLWPFINRRWSAVSHFLPAAPKLSGNGRIIGYSASLSLPIYIKVNHIWRRLLRLFSPIVNCPVGWLLMIHGRYALCYIYIYLYILSSCALRQLGDWISAPMAGFFVVFDWQQGKKERWESRSRSSVGLWRNFTSTKKERRQSSPSTLLSNQIIMFPTMTKV